ncbi:MAG: hypothetical protein PHD43_24415, partial [Methylococcales bacterium]|nr:hypothetical protein [Methylococcales bacterium]
AKKSELLVAESSVSTSEYVKNIARGFVKIAYQTQENYYQFTTENELSFKGLVGFEKIPKQEMRAKTYFSCQSVIDSVMSREKAQSYLGLLNQVGQSPLMQRNWVLQWYLWKDVIRNWDENLARDADTFMTDEIRDLLISQIQQAEQLAAQKEKEKEIAAVISEMEKPQGGQGGG